ncbi:MAG: hypothetical protein BWY15_02043 [Firmicutes bacterium ADurb.Bin193]|nr:MAG: hypothetical protein BWY15_02043 [Firmicutes bacterium ADurb.Bin193]
MVNSKKYPFVKAFLDYDDRVHLITYTSEEKSGYYSTGHIGNELINFCELDLSEYEKQLEKAKKEKLTPLNYDKMRNLVFDIAELTQEKHKYLFFYLVGALNNVFADITVVEFEDYFDALCGQIERCFEELESVLKLQEIFKDGVHLCLDKENLKHRTKAEKMVGFYYKYPGFSDFVLKTGFAIMPTYKRKLDYQVVKNMNDSNINDAAEQLKIIDYGKKGVSLIPYYVIESLEEMLFFEFNEMLRRGTDSKKCKLCGKYFAVFDNRNREYCDRIFNDGKTCKEVGAVIAYEKEKGEADSPLRLAEREYNKLYSRMSRATDKSTGTGSDKDMTPEEFKKWSKMYTREKKAFKAGNITAEEFLERIKHD